MEILHAGADVTVQDQTCYFTGIVIIEQRFERPAPARLTGAVVTFQPSARTAWHTHPIGQTLVVTSGSGFVQHEGEPAQHISLGDIVWIPPCVRHWHGASPTSIMTHVALAEALDGKVVDWLVKVSELEYRSSWDI